jgi:hypothetical protein
MKEPIYVANKDDQLFDCDKWTYKPEQFGNKVKIRTSFPQLNYKSTKSTECDLSEYEYLMNFAGIDYYILIEFKHFKEACNQHSIKVHKRLRIIKSIQKRQALEKHIQNVVEHEENYRPEFTWDLIEEFMPDETQARLNWISDLDLPEPLPGFKWIKISTISNLAGTAGWLEVNFDTQKYNRYFMTAIG